MSSHHFVKEGQEPALFILDPVDFELAGPFLEWAPFVIVSENALDQVLHWEIKIDGVLVSHWDEDIKTKLSGQAPIGIVRLDAKVSLIEHAFDYLIDHRQTGVNVLTTRPEMVFTDAERVTKQLHASIVDKNLRWVGISNGRFEKWLPTNAHIVIRKTAENQSIVIHGLTEKNGHFECTQEGIVRIESDAFFWIAESHT